MQVCNRCLYTSFHPLNIIFDKEGICSGCKIHEEKDEINWKERKEKLRSLLNQYKNTSGNNYDCIIPVSGARDSYFVVHVIKYIFGMNPLLVTYNKHYNTSVGVRNLANLRMQFDADLMTLTVNPQAVKNITRSTLRRFGSMYWHCLAGNTVYPVQMAVRLKIPLIIWGVHQGIDQVGMFSHYDEIEMTRKYRKEHDLMGYEAEDLINEFDNLNEEDLFHYFYPDSREIEMVGVRGIYLNNYFRWDSKSQHEQMINKYAYETAKQTRTFDTYNDIDCWNYSDVHDYIKYIKHGYGKVLDHACREIRLGRMKREEGINLMKKYNKLKPKNLRLFLDWLGITENSFHYIIDQHRKQDLWKKNKNWEWKLSRQFIKKSYANKPEQYALKIKEKNSKFLLTNTCKSVDPESKYILIGKGTL